MISPIFAVKDVDASVEFYVNKLGFEHDFSMPGPDGKNSFAFVKLADNAIGFTLVSDLDLRGNGVVVMIYPPTDFDIDKHYSDVQAKAVEIVEPLKTEYWGDRVFSVRDLDNYYLTFAKTVEKVPVEEIAAAHMAGTTD